MSLRTRARTPLLQLVVVPRSAALQATKDALSLVLVLGTRPTVTPAAMLHYLQEFYGITEDRISIRRTKPNDFIVRFARQEDLDLVLNHLCLVGAPSTLRWRR